MEFTLFLAQKFKAWILCFWQPEHSEQLLGDSGNSNNQKLHFLSSHLLVFLKIINIELPTYNRLRLSPKLWGIYGTHKKENPMNHLHLIELSIIPSQEFSSSKVELREESWWIGIDSEQMAKKIYPVQKIIVKCCNDNKRGTNNNALMIAKKISL